MGRNRRGAGAPAQRHHAGALDDFCKARIGGYKRPRRYIFVEELPKSATGKILKAELRQLVRSGHFDPKELLMKIQAVIAGGPLGRQRTQQA